MRNAVAGTLIDDRKPFDRLPIDRSIADKIPAPYIIGVHGTSHIGLLPKNCSKWKVNFLIPQKDLEEDSHEEE